MRDAPLQPAHVHEMLIEALGLRDSHLISLCGAGGKTTLMFSLAREFIAAGERVLITTTTKIAREEADGWRSFAALSSAQALELARAVLPENGPGRAGAVIAYAHVGHDGHRLAGFAPELVDALDKARKFDRILVEADGSARKPLKAPAAHEPVIPTATDTLIIVAGINGLGLPLGEENLFRADIWSRLSGLALGFPISAESLARCVAHPEGLTHGCPANARRMLFLNQADTPERNTAAKQVTECLAALPGNTVETVVIGQLLPQSGIAEVATLAPAPRNELFGVSE